MASCVSLARRSRAGQIAKRNWRIRDEERREVRGLARLYEKTMNTLRLRWCRWLVAGVLIASTTPLGLAAERGLHPVVQVEEQVYTYEPANNGAGPLWCSGSSCLTRVGPHLFASGLETIKECPPLNNCRWTLFERGTDGWHLILTDPVGRTREPCPLASFADGRFFLSANPTLLTNPVPGGGQAQPQILQFRAAAPSKPEVL